MDSRTASTRRQAMFGLAAAVPLKGQSTQAKAEGKLLTDGDRLDVGGRGPEMVERARSVGREFMSKHGNCAQSTIAALQDAIEFVPKNEHVFLAGSCLHGGATANGNASCGGFTGAGIVIGDLCGRSRDKFGDRGAVKLSSALIRDVAGKFEETYGTVICRDVREKAQKNCSEVVARASGWAAEVLLKQFAK